MEQLGLPAATMRRRVEETLDLLGLVRPASSRPARAVGRPAAARRDRVGADDAPAGAGARRADLGARPHRRRGRPGDARPAGARRRRLRGAGRAPAGAGASRSPTGCAWCPAGRRLGRRRPRRRAARRPGGPPIVELGRGGRVGPAAADGPRCPAPRPGLLDLAAVPGACRPVTAPAGLVDAAASSGGARARTVPVPRGRPVRCRAGSVTALMGRNGAGKSTLLWALQGSGVAGLRHASTSAGRDPADVGGRAAPRLVGLVPQTAADLLYLETVADECAAADRAPTPAPGPGRRCSSAWCPASTRGPHPRDLSEGQRLALVLAARAASTAPRPAPRRADPGPGLHRQGAADRHPAGALAAEGLAVLRGHPRRRVRGRTAPSACVVLAEGEVVSAGPADRVVAETPAFAPQVAKVLGAPVADRRPRRCGGAALGAA